MVKKEYHLENFNEKSTSKAIMKNQQISLKFSTEVCREIRGKTVKKVIPTLEKIISQEEYLPLRKYNKKVAHRKGQAKNKTKSGRYPVRVCEAFIKLIDSAKNNAVFKGLDEEKLIVLHAFASKGFSRMTRQTQGRIAGKNRQRKSTHIEVVLLEGKGF